MAQKSDKYAGMQDMFSAQEKIDKIAEFTAAKAKIEAEIRALENGINSEYDNGVGTVEDRNELNALNNELRQINAQIAELER